MNDDEAIVAPSDFIRHAAEYRKVPVEAIRVPRCLLLTYQRSIYEYAKKLIDGKDNDWLYGEAQPVCVGRFNGVEVGAARFWIGAPAAIMTLEEAIVCGAKTIFEVGLSGGLQDFLTPGDIVVVTEANRDEGTSNHYLEPSVKVEASPRLRDLLISIMKGKAARHFVGPVWTTDAVYRETCSEFRKFKNNGVLVVDMETSALFALAKYRNVEAASAQVISDVLTESGWLQAWRHQSVTSSIELVVRCVLEAMSSAFQ